MYRLVTSKPRLCSFTMDFGDYNLFHTIPFM